MGRVRTSTWVLLAVFLLTLATYILVRPAKGTSPTDTGVSPATVVPSSPRTTARQTPSPTPTPETTSTRSPAPTSAGPGSTTSPATRTTSRATSTSAPGAPQPTTSGTSGTSGATPS